MARTIIQSYQDPTRMNNWALALCDEGYYSEAERLLADGQQFEPSHATFAHNAAHVLQVWAQVKAGAQKTGPAVMPSL